jgi:hypothetical protein
MKPDWDKLTAEYKNHSTILIADVDCTSAGRSLCDEVGVKGFPTIKYGDPNDLDDYDGGRGYKALKDFAENKLGPRCGIAHIDLCGEDEKAQIESFKAMSIDELDRLILEKNDLMKAADKDLKEQLKSLQAQYEQAQKDAKDKKTEVTKSGLGLMKAAMAHRKSEL